MSSILRPQRVHVSEYNIYTHTDISNFNSFCRSQSFYVVFCLISFWARVRQSSSSPRAAAESQHTEPEPGGKPGTGGGPAWSRGPAIQPGLRTLCPPGTGQDGGRSTPGEASPAQRGLSGPRSGTAGLPLEKSPLHNLGRSQRTYLICSCNTTCSCTRQYACVLMWNESCCWPLSKKCFCHHLGRQ